jgi:anaerobic C4-dicarboxylate transporter
MTDEHRLVFNSRTIEDYHDPYQEAREEQDRIQESLAEKEEAERERLKVQRAEAPSEWPLWLAIAAVVSTGVLAAASANWEKDGGDVIEAIAYAVCIAMLMLFAGVMDLATRGNK